MQEVSKKGPWNVTPTVVMDLFRSSCRRERLLQTVENKEESDHFPENLDFRVSSSEKTLS